MATVDKNFKVKHGLVVEGTTATVNGEDIITTGSSTDNLPEGSTNQYYTTAKAKGDAADLLTNATLTNITITGNEDGLTITAENGGIQDLTGFDTDDLTEGSTNLYYTDARVDNHITAGNGISYSSGTISVNIVGDGGLHFDENELTIDRTTVDTWYDDSGAAAGVQSNLEDHATDTATHGVTGDIVGTSDSQTLSNKTFSTALSFNSGGGVAGSLGEDGSANMRLASTTYDLELHAGNDVIITTTSGDIVLDPDGGAYVGSATAGNDIATINTINTYVGDNTVDGSTGNTVADRIATAETNANSYTATQLGNYTLTSDLDETIDGYGYLKSADLSGYATESYVTTAVDNLVDGAPGLLDTLNEIAAAIADDENYATTMTTALAGKQNELTAGSNISIVSDTISVTGLASTDISDFGTAALSATASAYDVAGAAASAQTAAENYADGLASNYEPAGTTASAISALTTDDITEGDNNLYFSDARAVNAIQLTTPNFQTVEIDSVAKQVAATVTSLGSVVVTAYQFNKTAFKTAKFLVKIDNGTENEVSEILLTLDSSDNIAITEYAIVSTNGSRGTITADISGSHVRLRVNPVNDSTINVVGTLLV